MWTGKTKKKDLFSFVKLDAVDSDFCPDRIFKKSEKQSRNRERFKYLTSKALIKDKVISYRFGYGKRDINLKMVSFRSYQGKFLRSKKNSINTRIRNFNFF